MYIVHIFLLVFYLLHILWLWLLLLFGVAIFGPMCFACALHTEWYPYAQWIPLPICMWWHVQNSWLWYSVFLFRCFIYVSFIVFCPVFVISVCFAACCCCWLVTRCGFHSQQNQTNNIRIVCLCLVYVLHTVLHTKLYVNNMRISVCSFFYIHSFSFLSRSIRF